MQAGFELRYITSLAHRIGTDCVEAIAEGVNGCGIGLPAIAVPNGFSETGLPTSLQFMGRAWEENAILAAARAYQSLTDWHLRHPPGL